MCGRFTLRNPQYLEFDFFDMRGTPDFPPSYNIFPGQQILVLRSGEEIEMVSLRWGLTPHWSKESSNGIINARSETAAEKASFRKPYRERRCLILADGFFEWTKEGKKPYFFSQKDNRPFAFAGIWDLWNKGDPPVESCAILTTAANDLMRPIHDRMPVIVPRRLYSDWLSSSLQDPTKIKELIQSSKPDDLSAYPVTNYVNKPAHQGPKCIEPLEEEFHQPELF